MGDLLNTWDRELFLWLNHVLPNPLLDAIMPQVTHLGLGQVQVVLVLFTAIGMGWMAGEFRHGGLWSCARAALIARRSWVVPLIVAVMLSGLLSTLIKNTTDRDRPWEFYSNETKAGRYTGREVRTVPGVYPLKVRGFPSGHTSTSAAIATVLTVFSLRRRRGWIIAGMWWLLAGIVALSRLYLASHWPLDLIGGVLLGVFAGIGSVRLCRLPRPAGAPA